MTETKKKPSCFISYCHQDTNKESIYFLVNEIKSLAKSQINFYWDREQLTGTKLTTFMDNLYTCDAIVLLLTPEYKRKVDSREGGVYDEFQRIMDR